jgi:hypothetical protein
MRISQASSRKYCAFPFRENSLSPPASSSLSGAPSSRKANHKPPNTKTQTAEDQVHPTARSLTSCRIDFNANQPRFIPKVLCFSDFGKIVSTRLPVPVFPERRPPAKQTTKTQHQNPHRRWPGSPHSKKPDLMPKRFQCESATIHPESTVLSHFGKALSASRSAPVLQSAVLPQSKPQKLNTKTQTAEDQVHPTARSLTSCRRDFNANQSRSIPKVLCFPISGKHSQPAGQFPGFRVSSSGNKLTLKHQKPTPPMARFTPQQEA